MYYATVELKYDGNTVTGVIRDALYGYKFDFLDALGNFYSYMEEEPDVVHIHHEESGPDFTAIMASGKVLANHEIELPLDCDEDSHQYVLCNYYFSSKDIYHANCTRIEAVDCSDNMLELSNILASKALITVQPYMDQVNKYDLERMLREPTHAFHLKDKCAVNLQRKVIPLRQGRILRFRWTEDSLFKGYEYVVPRDGYTEHFCSEIYNVGNISNQSHG